MMTKHNRFRQSVIALCSLSAVMLSSCSALPWESDSDVFLKAFNAGDDSKAARYLDHPDPERALHEFRQSLHGVKVNIEKSDISNGKQNTHVTWSKDGVELESNGRLVLSGQDGKPQWLPSIFEAQLSDDSALFFAEDKQYDLPIKDRLGNEYMTWTKVIQVRGRKDIASRAQELAQIFAPVSPTTTKEWIEQTLGESQDEDTVLLTLRQEEFRKIQEQLRTFEGISTVEQGRLLSVSKTLNSPLDAELNKYWESVLDANSGWSIRAESSQGMTTVASEPPRRVQPIATTLDNTLQSAAKQAVDSEQRAAVLVVLNPRTGGVLAVAQNDKANNQGPIALTGLFPPGSTFKTVTTAAALEAGAVSMDEELPCPSNITVAGRTIPNDHDFDLGSVRLEEAFAQSCNTTQAVISDRLGEDDLQRTALELGIGSDFDVPGMTTLTGSVPRTPAGPPRVEASIGQGEVLASPFGIALMQSTVANGGLLVPPQLIQGEQTVVNKQADQHVSDTTIQSLRTMMKSTIDHGSARSLSDLSALGGKTGTAEIDGKLSNGWFAGTTGELAIASLVIEGDSSQPAVEMAGRFLRSPDVQKFSGIQ
ncbi:penicillin-binding transpeptidase domain-containing protein [Corynebacterium sp. MSK035]|uniref:penicillin-binding protein PBP2M n=1 Tax=Corynebacterium TaxID=1716 RepID=UPI0006674C6D|nr:MULTISPECIES: penicillin-binding transpeptidase domain-containing protein [Corynebacterium]ASE56740.1 penicillin-binding protein [Corynebacterium jeikeium]ASE56744.1 penicillin-binding protein [Corynebacterium jeikeium]AYX82426.1 penicillin-binding protein [Corynebacterium jeikeium]KAA9222114.1 penicillin-binding protein [Corynebacterium amycolatum]KAA9243746.1 penicillin-binding protein [Corynebacterium amycolatum]